MLVVRHYKTDKTPILISSNHNYLRLDREIRVRVFIFLPPIRPFEREFEKGEVVFEFRSENKVRFVFRSLDLGLEVAGGEGDDAVVGRPPPSSPAGLAMRMMTERE